MSNSFNIEPEFIVEQLSSVTSRNQLMSTEEFDVAASEFKQLGFLLVVDDEGDHRWGVPFNNMKINYLIQCLLFLHRHLGFAAIFPRTP